MFWNEEHVPQAMLVDPVVVTGPIILLILTYLWGKLMCADSSWHVGQLKRVILRAFVAFILACLCWFAEELGFTPCPSAFTLHWLWHVLSAYALLGWCALPRPIRLVRPRLHGFTRTAGPALSSTTAAASLDLRCSSKAIGCAHMCAGRSAACF